MRLRHQAVVVVGGKRRGEIPGKIGSNGVVTCMAKVMS
jgi:hypothetical protein